MRVSNRFRPPTIFVLHPPPLLHSSLCNFASDWQSLAWSPRLVAFRANQLAVFLNLRLLLRFSQAMSPHSFRTDTSQASVRGCYRVCCNWTQASLLLGFS